jgi:hypothetical protein
MRADVADFKHTLRYRRGSSCYRARRPFMVTTIPVFSIALAQMEGRAVAAAGVTLIGCLLQSITGQFEQ